MTDRQIKLLAVKYRIAIETARDNGIFVHDISFDEFPTGCCGDTCYLLAEYMRKNGIETIWNSAQRADWTHSWLIVKDRRIKISTSRTFVWPNEIREVVARYGVEHPEQEVEISGYVSEDLQDGLIIDITADQFEDYNHSVYVGYMDSFHQTFELIQAHDYDELNNERLRKLYQSIARFLCE